MKWLVILAAVLALVGARPETYKEQEDFQYSRSSSDEGSKSGYYGAQRGNMGGNYERAHNMDTLAQNQMSGLVRQVESELGEGANTRAGSIYSAANTKGIYGSRSVDTSNLGGRNFEEGTSFDDSHLRSSLTHSSSTHNRGSYSNMNSHYYSGHRKTTSDAQTQTDEIQPLDNLQTSNQHNYGSTRSSSCYQSQVGFREQSQYDHDSANSHSGYGSNVYTRLTPVRIIVTPTGRVALPVAVQIYYANHESSIYNHKALQSETDSTGEVNQDPAHRPSGGKYYETSYRYNKKWEKHDTVPTSVSRVTPTASTIPKNSELYEDVDVHTSGSQSHTRGVDYQSAHSTSASGRYNTAKSSGQSDYYSGRHRHEDSSNSDANALTETEYKSHLDKGFSFDSLNTYTQAQHSGSRYHSVSGDSDLNTQSRYKAGSQLDLNGHVEDLNTRPKSYQSSYSYHKSWERQGDPYVIKPASTAYSDGQTSQRYTSSTKNQEFDGYQSRSQYNTNQRSCEDKCHLRVARSYGTDVEQQSQNLYDGDNLIRQEHDQLSQQSWNQQTTGQQSQGQWDDLKDLSQQSQSTWEQQNNEQQSQNQWDNLENLGQQSQNNWNQQNVTQQTQNPRHDLANSSQQSQSNWDQQNNEQQSQNQWDNLPNLGQQSQNYWDQPNVAQQTQNQRHDSENLGQQSQSNWDQQNNEQQSQNQWDKLENLGQQSQNNWDQQNVAQQTQTPRHVPGNLSQQSQSNWDQQNNEQQSQNQWDNLENLGQKSQNSWDQQNVAQQTQNPRHDSENLIQQSQSNWDQQNDGPQSQKQVNTFENPHSLVQHSQNNRDQVNIETQTQKQENSGRLQFWNKIETLDQQSHNNLDQSQSQFTQQNGEHEFPKRGDAKKLPQQSLTNWGKLEDVGQQSLDQNTWDKLEDIRQENQKSDNSDFFGHYAQNFLGQHNQDIEREVGFKHQNELYAQYEHKSDTTSKGINFEQLKPVYENSKQIKNLWDKLGSIDSINSKVAIGNKQNSKENDTDFRTLVNKDEEINFFATQHKPNDNSDYNYSHGFINPFFNQYHKSQLSNNDDINLENPSVFDSNTRNSDVQSLSNAQISWQTDDHYNSNIQHNSLRSLWSKLKARRTDFFPAKNQTESKFTSLTENQKNTLSEIQLQHVQNLQQAEATTISESHHNKNVQDTTELFKNKNEPKQLQVFSGENPETPKDIGRRDIGPEDVIDINESNNQYKIPTSTIAVNTIDKPVEHEQDNNSYIKTGLPDDQLSVLSIQQQKSKNNVVLSNKSHTSQFHLNNTVNETQPYHGIHENVEQQYLNNFQGILPVFENRNENLQQQNLYNFGHKQMVDAIKKNHYLQNKSFEHEINLDFAKQNTNISQENTQLFRNKNVEVTEMTTENLQQQKSEPENYSNNTNNNLQFINQQNGKTSLSNLPSMQDSKLDKLDNFKNYLKPVQHDVQTLEQQSKHLQHQQLEQNYFDDFKPSTFNSFEQNLQQELEQQQAFNENLHNSEQQSVNINIKPLEKSTQEYNAPIDLKNFATASTQKIYTSQYDQNHEVVTEKTGFWKSVGIKISSAKDKVVSWLKKTGFWKSVGIKISSAKDKVVSWFKS